VKKSNEAKVTLWTDTMKSEFSGTISGCVLEMFGYIMPSKAKTKTAAEMREQVLKLLQRQHEQLKAVGR
jgi:hypothetical protein